MFVLWIILTILSEIEQAERRQKGNQNEIHKF